jgi:hypothetical protein
VLNQIADMGMGADDMGMDMNMGTTSTREFFYLWHFELVFKGFNFFKKKF